MTLLLAYILTIDYSYIFHRKQVVNKVAHVFVCGETFCYSYLSWGHRTVYGPFLTVNQRMFTEIEVL